MYVCMYVCFSAHVCMYVCTVHSVHVCMYERVFLRDTQALTPVGQLATSSLLIACPFQAACDGTTNQKIQFCSQISVCVWHSKNCGEIHTPLSGPPQNSVKKPKPPGMGPGS